jgi:segregation and condensation protein A
MPPSAYTVNTTVFDGPLDLLLSLIEKRKLFINDIALAEVANDYLRYVEQHNDFPLAETAQFVLVGSTLLFIKSKSLLPSLALSEEESESMEDLEMRLKVLDRYRAGARHLVEHWGIHPLFSRRRVLRSVPVFTPDARTTQDALHGAMQEVLQRLPEPKNTSVPQATLKKVVSLEETMERLTKRLNDGVNLSFREFSGSGRVEIIVSFLAMLELVRQGMIRVEQGSDTHDIVISTDSVGLPRYG